MKCLLPPRTAIEKVGAIMISGPLETDIFQF